MGDTFDLVPIGAWYGKGKRTGGRVLRSAGQGILHASLRGGLRGCVGVEMQVNLHVRRVVRGLVGVRTLVLQAGAAVSFCIVGALLTRLVS